MFHFHLIHVNYLILGVMGLVFIFFLWKKWDFVAKASSDGNIASMTRLCGFMITIAHCFMDIYTALASMHYDIEHLKFNLLMIGVLFGLIKMVDLLTIWRGGTPTAPPAAAEPEKEKENV